jgi:hypothetical protein
LFWLRLSSGNGSFSLRLALFFLYFFKNDHASPRPSKGRDGFRGRSCS